MMKKIIFTLCIFSLLFSCKPAQLAISESESESVFFIPNLAWHDYRIEYLTSYESIDATILDNQLDDRSWIEMLSTKAISLHQVSMVDQQQTNIDKYIDASVSKFEWNLRTGKLHPYCLKGNRLKAVDTLKRVNKQGTFLNSNWNQNDSDMLALQSLTSTNANSKVYVLLYTSAQDNQNQRHRSKLALLAFPVS